MRLVLAVEVLLLAAAWAWHTPVGLAAEDGRAVSHMSFFDGWPKDAYELDAVDRWLPKGKRRLKCDTDEMVVHRSRRLRYRVRVHSAFAERLERFETLVMDLATEHYGRPPRRLIHHGGFACRNARGRRERTSEHALGNAIDLKGFDFGRLPRSAAAPTDLPRHLRRAFRVRVAQHWKRRRRRDGHHAAFLHKLAETLRERPDIFRGIVGPPRPRHGNHLHLDASPWRYAMFGYPSPIDGFQARH